MHAAAVSAIATITRIPVHIPMRINGNRTIIIVGAIRRSDVARASDIARTTVVVSAICYCSPYDTCGKAHKEGSHWVRLLRLGNNDRRLLGGASGYIDLLLLRLWADHCASIEITSTNNSLSLSTISLTISRRRHHGAGDQSKTEVLTFTHDILPSLLLTFW